MEKQIIKLTIKILLINDEILIESAKYEVAKLLEHELYHNLLMDYLKDSQLTHDDIVYYQILCNDEVVFVSHNRNKIYEKLTKNSLSQKKYKNI
jgi:hypothetical protein